MEELELIRLAKKGDACAFNRLIENYQREVFNFAARLLGNTYDAEDACQRSWLAAWKALTKFREGNFRAWIYRIVTNKCKDEFRRRNRHLTIPLDEYTTVAVNSDTSHIERETLETVQKAMLELSHKEREAVILRDFNDLDYGEISVILQCSISAAKIRVQRGRVKLRDIIRRSDEIL